MGMDCVITYAREREPSWPAVAERLRARGLTAQVRMIDGELAFPDEVPGEGWKDLRLGMPHGMVTLRREPDAMRLVIWGNACAELLHERDQMAAAIVELTQGTIQE